MIRIGIDNGVSGSIGIVGDGEAKLFPTPVFKTLNYTKKKGYINRVDVDKLKALLEPYSSLGSIVKIERPMVNPGRFKASLSAIRALEATSVALEQLGLGYVIVDSKEWQGEFLPSGIKGAANLKKASALKGVQMFPNLKDEIKKQGDADSLFIAMLDV